MRRSLREWTRGSLGREIRGRVRRIPVRRAVPRMVWSPRSRDSGPRCAPATKRPSRTGISAPAATPADLNGALLQARYALTAARRAEGPNLTAVDGLTTLEALLSGLPADVRTAFGIHALGPLADDSNPSHRMLLETLDTFLTPNGSWARTAEALHLHVNTVHYRIGRVELLTGRDLARLDHKLNLKAALLCR